MLRQLKTKFVIVAPSNHEALYIYYCEMRAYKAQICDERLKEKSEYFAQMLCDENGISMINGKFRYSNHWLYNLKNRYAIKFRFSCVFLFVIN